MQLVRNSLVLILCVLLLTSHGLQATAALAAEDRPVNVAVCFFGLTRSLQYTIDSIRTHILDVLVLAGIRYDVYLHTHNVTLIYNPRARENNLSADPTLYRLLRPDKAILEDPIDWNQPSNQALLKTILKNGDPWRETGEHISIRNVIGQLNSLLSLTSLWSAKSNEYDAVIYLRSDVWFYNDLNVTQLLEAARTKSRPVIWTPNFHTFGGLNDRFAFGNAAAMRAYGSRWLLATKFCQETSLHAERFLLYSMRQGNVTCRGTDSVFSRIRGDGTVVDAPVMTGGTLSTTQVKKTFAYRLMRTADFGNWHPVRATAAKRPPPLVTQQRRVQQ